MSFFLTYFTLHDKLYVHPHHCDGLNFVPFYGSVIIQGGLLRWRGRQKTCLSVQEMQETRIRSLDREGPLEEGTATHSSILAWRISWTEETGGLQSMGWQNWTRLKQVSMHSV